MIRPRARRGGPTSDEPTLEDTEADDIEPGNIEPGDGEAPAPRRRWLAPRRDPDVTALDDDLALKPSAMRGTEALYGYVVGLELIAVSILNLTVTHGKGAPTHPSTGLAVVGLAASMAFLAVVRTHHRLVVPLAAIVAAFFVTLPKVPDSLSLAHLFALIVPVIYAFVLTQRQRKAATARARAGRSATGRSTPAERKADVVNRRRARRQGAIQTGPTANRRYTPPKGKRPRR